MASSRAVAVTRMRPGHLCLGCARRWTSSSTIPASPTGPPLLLKLRRDMKEALKARDTNRLDVLRGILAEVTNAAKTPTPLKTDIQLLSLLRKQAAASRAAASEFSSAKRADLADKENAQVAVLEEYAAGVETIGEEEMTGTIQHVIGKLRTEGQEAVNAGTVLKSLFAPGGELDGKPVDRAEAARLVKGML